MDAAIAERDAAAGAHAEALSAWAGAVAGRDAIIAERDAELAEAGARINELDRVSAHLSRLVVQRERELDGLRDQVDEVCARARGYATRVRMQALRQAASIAAPKGQGNGNGNGSHEGAGDEPDRAPAAEPERAAVFEGIVQLEIGPLADFSQLVGFEDAAGSIGAASEISVTRFSRGRASLDVRLREPVDLLRELEERSPFEFRVRKVRDGRLILDLGDDEAEAGAA